MKLYHLICAPLLALASLASATVINPTSYDMNNGHGTASGGTFNYWDLNYTGAGSTATDNALLSGGLGDLTDGFITTDNWFNVENAAGTGPYVGWRQGVLPVLQIAFNFAGPVNIDTIRIHADDSAGAGGVNLPISAIFTWAGGGIASFLAIADPDLGIAPSWLNFANLGIAGVSSVTVELGYGNEWIFVDEVTFSTVPEPGTFALVLAGFGLLGFAARRRK